MHKETEKESRFLENLSFPLLIFLKDELRLHLRLDMLKQQSVSLDNAYEEEKVATLKL